MIKAISTWYNGHEFRSRLEARWAVFLDDIGIEFEYEPEGYQHKDGERYLPDFYLPHVEMFAEVKPFRSDSDTRRLERFALDGLGAVVLFDGPPKLKPYTCWIKIQAEPFNPDLLDSSVSLDIHWGRNARYYAEEHRFYTDPDPLISCDRNCWSRRYIEAVDYANGARFEFEDSVKPRRGK